MASSLDMCEWNAIVWLGAHALCNVTDAADETYTVTAGNAQRGIPRAATSSSRANPLDRLSKLTWHGHWSYSTHSK